MSFSDRVNNLRSGRVREIEDHTPAPTAFQTYGGWGSADDAAAADLDPIEDERTARRAGAAGLVELEAQRLERVRAQRAADLANVRRGRNYGGPGA